MTDGKEKNHVPPFLFLSSSYSIFFFPDPDFPAFVFSAAV